MKFNLGEVASYYRERVPNLKQMGFGEWRGSCPVHHGERESFAVDPENGSAYCYSKCHRRWGILQLEQALTGADPKTAMAEVIRIVGRNDPAANQLNLTVSEFVRFRAAAGKPITEEQARKLLAAG